MFPTSHQPRSRRLVRRGRCAHQIVVSPPPDYFTSQSEFSGGGSGGAPGGFHVNFTHHGDNIYNLTAPGRYDVDIRHEYTFRNQNPGGHPFFDGGLRSTWGNSRSSGDGDYDVNTWNCPTPPPPPPSASQQIAIPQQTEAKEAVGFLSQPMPAINPGFGSTGNIIMRQDTPTTTPVFPSTTQQQSQRARRTSTVAHVGSPFTRRRLSPVASTCTSTTTPESSPLHSFSFSPSPEAFGFVPEKFFEEEDSLDCWSSDAIVGTLEPIDK